jgi:succinyl-diaminopimelate desuccinylase
VTQTFSLGDLAAAWLARLVRIPSVNPGQAGPRAGEPGEARLIKEVERWLAELGAQTHRQAVLPGRENLYAVFTGRADPARWAALDVHVDTVGVEQMTGDPFSGELREGRVWGRGAVDTKASLACALAVLQAGASRGVGPGPNLLLSASVDEEVGAEGAPAVRDWVGEQGLVLDEMAVAEPTRCGPVVGHKGVLRLGVEIEGAPAHSSQPHLGRNAITAAARAVLALHAEHERLQRESTSPLGPGTLTVTLISGGTGYNVVPDRCTLFADRRVAAGESLQALEAQLRDLVSEASGLPVRCVPQKSIEPFHQDPDAPWVRRLAEWSGMAPAVVPYGTNAWAYGGIARELVVIGPGSIDQAHGVEEWVEVSELERMARILARWWGMEAIL